MPKIIDDQQVYRAALALFVRRGYASATTREIAAAAGIHEATLFRKYGTKANLIEQAIRNELADTPLHRVTCTGDVRADLQAIIEAYQETNALHGEIIPALISQAQYNPELEAALMIPLSNLQGIVAVIEHYQSRGVLRQEPPLHTINVLIAPLMVAHMVRRTTVRLPFLPIDPAEHVELFLSGRHKQPVRTQNRG